jgi:hypothetical protein
VLLPQPHDEHHGDDDETHQQHRQPDDMDHPVPEFPAGQKFFPQFFFSDILQFFSYDSSLTLQLQGCQMVYIFSNQTPSFWCILEGL